MKISGRQSGHGGNDSLLQLIPISLVLGLLYLVTNSVINIIGIAFLVICLSSTYLYLYKSQKKLDGVLYALIICSCILNFILYVNEPSEIAVRNLIVQSIVYLFIGGIVSIGHEETLISCYRRMLIAVLIALIPFIFLIILSGGGDAHIRLFNDYFGFVIYKSLLVVFCSLFFSRINKVLILVIFVALFLAIGDRASAICCIVFYFAFILYPSIISYRRLKWVLFSLIIGLGVVLPTLYVASSGTPIGLEINQFSRTYFGANFYSGRNLLWDQALQMISENPIIGNGLNSRIVEGGSNVSLHNTFLTIIFQSGIIGFILFVCVLARLWSLITRKRIDINSRISFGVITLLLVLSCFEVTMIQNTVNLSMMLWLLVANGCYHNSDESEVLGVENEKQ